MEIDDAVEKYRKRANELAISLQSLDTQILRVEGELNKLKREYNKNKTKHTQTVNILAALLNAKGEEYDTTSND